MLAIATSGVRKFRRKGSSRTPRRNNARPTRAHLLEEGQDWSTRRKEVARPWTVGRKVPRNHPDQGTGLENERKGLKKRKKRTDRAARLKKKEDPLDPSQKPGR